MNAAPSTPEPDQRASVFYVGQDQAGHWLVQESHGLLEGRFISRDAAWRFARSEIHAYPGGHIVFTMQCIVPTIPFEPVPEAATLVLDRAA
ncbi:hypothetical protein [Novosphingobium sp. ZW T3_23]|uniref:hypothetical protein n=1 Tax=Novosphingobium sp. ZW T3_23 TaxID=3378084 RepID=UPI0038518EFE